MADEFESEEESRAVGDAELLELLAANSSKLQVSKESEAECYDPNHQQNNHPAKQSLRE
jgi:hypothetical protein